jgi:hypothetical protein
MSDLWMRIRTNPHYLARFWSATFLIEIDRDPYPIFSWNSLQIRPQATRKYGASTHTSDLPLRSNWIRELYKVGFGNIKWDPDPPKRPDPQHWIKCHHLSTSPAVTIWCCMDGYSKSILSDGRVKAGGGGGSAGKLGDGPRRHRHRGDGYQTRYRQGAYYLPARHPL